MKKYEMTINLTWHNKQPKNIQESLNHITRLICDGFISGELCELEVDENEKEEEIRGWWEFRKQ